MTPKEKHFEMIEDYLMDALNHIEKVDFEKELKENSELLKQVKLETEMRSAILEKDILDLQNKLKSVSKESHTGETPFSLFNDFENFQELSSTMPAEELMNFYDSMPRAHVYQREISSNENIHEFFREQNIPGISNNIDIFDSDEDEIGLEGLGDAILEKDVLELREILGKVSDSVRHRFSVEDIDNYINGELDGDELKRFENELSLNSLLQKEVALHKEIESALLEHDVISLREDISRMMASETSWNVTEKQIEAFLSDELAGDELEFFRNELNENSDLKAEVALRRSVDKAVGEKDIIALRNELHKVHKDIDNKEIKSLIPDTGVSYAGWWRTGVAVAIILFAFAGIFRSEFDSITGSYEKFYSSPEWSPQRSVVAVNDVLQQANGFFVTGEYEKALALYDNAIKENDEKFVFQFYKAASLQKLQKYEDAVSEYSKVIFHGDNLFIEEAEWYKALCYLKLEQKNHARNQLMAVVNRKGFYSNDAKAILRKTKFSF